jgi:hypothetical protein
VRSYSQSDKEDWGNLVEVGPGEGLATLNVGGEGALFEGIKGEASGEEGGQERGEGAVKVGVWFGLAADTQATPGGWTHVVGELEGMGCDQPFLAIFLLDHFGNAYRVEAGVHDREDEAPTGLEQLGEDAGERLDGGHVHEGHGGDGGVEAVLAQSQQLGLVGGVKHLIVDALGVVARVGAGALDKDGAEVEGCNLGAEPGETAGEDAVAAGDVENVVVGLQFQEALGGWADEDLLEFTALGTHEVVPMGGVAVPDSLGFLGDCIIVVAHHSTPFI